MLEHSTYVGENVLFPLPSKKPFAKIHYNGKTSLQKDAY